MERGRFAPSPSGSLHLGSARTALACERSIHAVHGALILRVEDLDAARVATGATAALQTDLAWLGIRFDEGPEPSGPSYPYVQSQRRALYDAAFDQLRREGRVYPCACSRREVELASVAPHGTEPVYPGTCRARSWDAVFDEARARGRDVAWRFAVPAGRVPFHDARAGAQSQDVATEVGDFVVRRADGVPAYQLAVVVDDIAMGITEVVRGDDLLGSTARQILLYEAFGAAPPRWHHVPLVVGEDGVRLAKRHGSITIASLRERGVSATRLRSALRETLDHPGPLPCAALYASLPEIRERVPEA